VTDEVKEWLLSSKLKSTLEELSSNSASITTLASIDCSKENWENDVYKNVTPWLAS
jgi:hypothetical protein